MDAFVEVTLKDDDRNDPPINKDGLAQLGLLTTDEYVTLEALTKEISGVVKENLQQKVLTCMILNLNLDAMVKQVTSC